MDKLISVVMCTRNRGTEMLPSIKCILDQSFTNFELLIVNDASTDNTENVLLQLEKQDSRIRHITLKEHNFIEARNTGFREALGEYIVIMDSDDKCSPNRLREQYDYLESHKDIDCVGCKIKFGGKSEHYSIPNTEINYSHDYFDKCMKNNENISMLVCFGTMMFRKSTLDKVFKNKIYFYDEMINGGEDQVLCYVLYANGAKFANINTATYLYNYLMFDDSISASVGKHFNNDNFIFKYIHGKSLTEKLKVVNELYQKHNYV